MFALALQRPFWIGKLGAFHADSWGKHTHAIILHIPYTQIQFMMYIPARIPEEVPTALPVRSALMELRKSLLKVLPVGAELLA